MKNPIAGRAALLVALVVLPAMAADRWVRITTPYFELFTTVDEKKGKEAILYFERVREFFMRASPVRPPGEFPTRIVAFGDPQQFRLNSASPLALAYFAPGPLRDSIVMQEPSATNYPVAIHEYVHLVVRHSGLRLPLWLNEGWADVYSTLRPVKDGVAVGDLIQGHIATLEHGDWFSLEELESIDNHSKDYNESSRAGMFYAESWALAHMLYLSPDYKDNFGKFIDSLNRGGKLDEASQKAFGKTASQLFTDLRSYLSRKKLFGTVFLTPFQRADETPAVANVSDYDKDLMLGDVSAASNHPDNARQTYARLQTLDPQRQEAFQAAGYLAVQLRDADTARKEFEKAFELGSTDAQLCLELAALEREAKQPPVLIVAALERAVKLRPDFTEALFELGLMKAGSRDFEGALTLLGRVPDVAPARVLIFRTALAYCNLQTGNLDAARTNIEIARKAAQSPADTQGIEQVSRLIDARSTGPAAAQPGQKLVRAEGTAVGLKCVAPGSGATMMLGIKVEGRQILLHMPDAAALEVTRPAGVKAELKCGLLDPFPIRIEYSLYTPGTASNDGATGVVRRLEF